MVTASATPRSHSLISALLSAAAEPYSSDFWQNSDSLAVKK